jgi:HSP20 family protein
MTYDTHYPKYEIYESEKEWKILMPSVGAKREDVVVQMESDYLTISCKPSYVRPEGSPVTHKSLPLSQTHKTFIPNKDVLDTDNITAKLVDGILEVTIPVRETAQPRKIEIQG